jgi:hypothetical protein
MRRRRRKDFGTVSTDKRPAFRVSILSIRLLVRLSVCLSGLVLDTLFSFPPTHANKVQMAPTSKYTPNFYSMPIPEPNAIQRPRRSVSSATLDPGCHEREHLAGWTPYSSDISLWNTLSCCPSH